MKERFGKSSKQKQPEEEQLSTAHPSISDGKKLFSSGNGGVYFISCERLESTDIL